jgi:hypothetical protein
MTTKHDVIRIHQIEPTWAAPQIASYLGCHPSYVHATAKRNGLTLPSMHRENNDPRALRASARALRIRAEKLEERAKALEGRTP